MYRHLHTLTLLELWGELAKVGEMKLFPQIYGDFGANLSFSYLALFGLVFKYTVMSPEGDGRLLPSGILWSHGGLSG